MNYKKTIFGIDISSSSFNKIIGLQKWKSFKHSLVKMGCNDKSLFVIGKTVKDDTEKEEIINCIERLTGQKNSEFSFSNYSCGYYEVNGENMMNEDDKVIDKIYKSNFFYRIKRSIKFLFQRVFRGWSDAETWSLDVTFAKLICPRLKRFKKLNNGYPSRFTEKTWDEALDEMIFAFEKCANRFDYDEWTSEEFGRINSGLKLFSENFHDLWW
jgi:hypothetical protein